MPDVYNRACVQECISAGVSRCTRTRGGKEVTRTGMYLKVSSYAVLEGGDTVNSTRLKQTHTLSDARKIVPASTVCFCN